MRKFISLFLVFTLILSMYSVSAFGAVNLDVTFSKEGGIFKEGFKLTLSSVPGARIYYTLNSTDPDVSKIGHGTFEYNEPIQIRNNSTDKNVCATKPVFGQGFTLSENVNIPKCMVVKAIAVAEGQTSDIRVNSYIVDEEGIDKYELPIICLSTNPDNLYDSQNGLFANANLQNSDILEDYEKPLHMEYIDENGDRVMSQGIGVRLHGNSTKNIVQKTLRLYARKEYDSNNSKFQYEMFPWKKNVDGGRITSYKRLLLRNSGNDFGSTMLRDAFNQWLVRDLNIDIQDYRPAVAYVCGEFYGIVNIRERYDNEYCASNYNVKKSDVVLIQDPLPYGGQLDEGEPGDHMDYVNLHRFIDDSDLNDPENYNYVNSKIDLDCMKDYFMMQNFIVNTDWPIKNTRIWRSKQANPVKGVRGKDGRWRYMLCDTDISTDMWRNPHESAQDDQFDFIMDTQSGFPDAKRIFQRMMTSDKFKKDFLDNYVKNINTTYNFNRVKDIMYQMRSKIQKAAPYVQQRYNTLGNLIGATDSLLTFYNERPAHVLNQISTKYNYGDIVNLQLNSVLDDNGYITMDGKPFESTMLEENAFKGKYFKDITLKLKANPIDGYRFKEWKITEGNNSRILVDDELEYTFNDEDVIITPKYELMPTNPPTEPPTQEPTAPPTQEPTAPPTQEPTAPPTQEPTAVPTQEPTPVENPTTEPTPYRTAEPSQEPTPFSTMEPTVQPTKDTVEPSANPNDEADLKEGLSVKLTKKVSSNSLFVRGKCSVSNTIVKLKYNKKIYTKQVKKKNFSFKVKNLKPGARISLFASKNGYKNSKTIKNKVLFGKPDIHFYVNNRIKGSVYKGSKVQAYVKNKLIKRFTSDKKSRFSFLINKKYKKGTVIILKAKYKKHKATTRFKIF